MSLLDDTVQQLVSAAFAPTLLRLKRSAAYMDGVRDGAYHGFGRDTAFPHVAGTPECDAYLAGLDEGRALARQFRQQQEGLAHA